VRPTKLIQSTSFRLAAWYAVVFGVSVAILLAVVFWSTRNVLEQQTVSSIERESNFLVVVRSRGYDNAVRGIDRRMVDLNPPRRYYLLQSVSGERVAGNLPAMQPREGWFTMPVPAGETPVTGREAMDRRNTILVLGRLLPDGEYLAVGENRYREVRAEEAILQAMAWGMLLAILLAFGGGVLVRRGFLRRIEGINHTTRAIMDGNLSDRVPARGSDDELDQLSVNLNAMLDRIESLMESLKRVSDDVAHDLRTPLSRLRNRLELARERARAGANCEPAIDEALDELNHILDTFAALLRIAQIESGTRRAAFGPVKLGDIVAQAAETYTAVAEDHNQQLSARIGVTTMINGDRELLAQMIANLIENSIRHCPGGTRIEVSLAAEGDDAVLKVADNGPGIPGEEREKVLRRFYRLESSRTTPGSGLGLALVKAVADLHGAPLELTGNSPGLTVVVRLRLLDEARRSEESVQRSQPGFSPAL
jgi:signal transduction histidine kinase